MLLPRIRVFVSSPSDVGAERERVRRVLDGLAARYAGYVELEPVFWEDLVPSSGASPQVGIEEAVRPDMCDVVIGLLWARLGTPLHGDRVTGTERELRSAFAAHDRSRAAGDDPVRPEVFA